MGLFRIGSKPKKKEVYKVEKKEKEYDDDGLFGEEDREIEKK